MISVYRADQLNRFAHLSNIWTIQILSLNGKVYIRFIIFLQTSFFFFFFHLLADGGVKALKTGRLGVKKFGTGRGVTVFFRGGVGASALNTSYGMFLKLCCCQIIQYFLFADLKTISCVLFTLYDSGNMGFLLKKFAKTSTTIVKYELRIVKSNRDWNTGTELLIWITGLLDYKLTWWTKT